MSRKLTVTFQPNNTLKAGYFRMLRDIYEEVADNRWLTWQLFKRNFLSTYKQSVLGLLWMVILPLGSLITVVLLNQAGIFRVGEISVPYPIYAVFGLSLFQFFAGALSACATSLSNASNIITRINFSRKAIVFASVGQSCVAMLAQAAILIPLCLYFQFLPYGYICLLPLMTLPLILFTLGIGLVVAIVNSFLNDVGRAITGLMGFFLLLTPVLYARPSTDSLLSKLIDWNPVYYLVCFPRDLSLTGHSDLFMGFFVAATISVFLFIAGLLVFHQTESRITERI